jgi:WD40 repeat protein
VLLQEVLAADWCKYNDCVIATGGTDHTIKTWDVRMPQRELTTLLGHTLAVRRWESELINPAALEFARKKASDQSVVCTDRMVTLCNAPYTGWCFRHMRKTSWPPAHTT